MQTITKPSVFSFDSLPSSAMVDDETFAVVLGCHRNTIWRKAKAGDLPKPIKTGPRSTRWQVGAIREYLASLTAQQSAA
ncbi:helix-turn-helix transcriptional regulator [Thauera sp.]|uniref:helix-turn-helix transcriptional regulator n=1 Tax=Thauera sp. TaxID=1905334 RepID=UPI0039E2AA5E